MKISFDIDGTYAEHPDVFDGLALMLQAAGHEVGFLTGRAEDEKVENEIGVGFEPDFEIYLGLDKEASPQERCMDKSTAIQEEGIDLHYDDEDFFPDWVEVIIV